MFEDLKKYRVILVTGPHRSGTTICARMIAADTGHDFVIEEEINYGRLHLLATFIQSNYGPLVVQCPGLCAYVDNLAERIGIDYDETMVVMMHRYRRHIVESEIRSPANFRAMEAKQKAVYHAQHLPQHISDVKYAMWESQCRMIPNAMDVGYESLSEHPLWNDDHKNLKFQHAITPLPMPKVFRDGINALQNI